MIMFGISIAARPLKTIKSDMLSYIVLPFLNHTILLFSVEALQLLISLLHLNTVISIISTPLYCKAPL